MKTIFIAMSLSFVFFLPPEVVAQRIPSTLKGTIMDSYGALVPNAVVSAIGKDGRTYNVKSDQTGKYELKVAVESVYKIQIVLRPFKGFKIEEYQLIEGATLTLDVCLICEDCEKIEHLGASDRSVVGDGGGGGGEVGLGERADLSYCGAGWVEYGNASAFLTSGVDLAAEELAVRCKACFENCGECRFFPENKPTIGREIAEAVGDQTVFINFHSAKDVRAVAEHEVGPGVDDRACKERKIAAFFAEEHFKRVRHIL